MARLTKMRAKQTRAAESYTASDENLATDGEVERRVLKHSEMFHGNSNNNTVFTFDSSGVLSEINNYNANDDLIKHSVFTFDNFNTLTGIYLEVYDPELNLYIKKQKDISYDAYGNIHSIKNTII
jgi:hypothetical protein